LVFTLITTRITQTGDDGLRDEQQNQPENSESGGIMELPQAPNGKGNARLRTIERVRVIRIRYTNYCVCDGAVPLAVYSNKDDADLHRQRLSNQADERWFAHILATQE
jgi:hypothetical protein